MVSGDNDLTALLINMFKNADMCEDSATFVGALSMAAQVELYYTFMSLG